MPPFQRLLLGAASSCRFPNAPDDVWFALRCRHTVIHKPARASTGFNLIKNNVLRGFWGARPCAGHLQEKTFRPVDKLCLSLGQPVTFSSRATNFSPGTVVTLEAHQPRQAPEIAAFSVTTAPPLSRLNNALARVDENFCAVSKKGLSHPPPPCIDRKGYL